MNKVAQVLAALEALTLIAVGVLEAFFYRSPELYGIFLIEPGDYDAVRLWTVNVGFYNMLMGLALIVGVVLREPIAGRGRPRDRAHHLSAMHVVLGIVLVITEPALWLNGVGEAGLAIAVILAVVIGDRRSRADAAAATPAGTATPAPPAP